jgi:hypothetical protein
VAFLARTIDVFFNRIFGSCEQERRGAVYRKTTVIPQDPTTQSAAYSMSPMSEAPVG